LNKSLEQLIQLSKFDSQISSFGPQVELQNEKLAQFMSLANKLEAQVNERYAAIDEATSKKIKNNIHLSELNDKIEDVAKKTNSISTQKEAKALQLEEEIAREQISFTNEEIVRLDNIIELKEDELKDLKVKLSQEQETVKELQENIAKEIASLDKQRNKIATARNQVVEKVDNKVLSFYEKIRRWAKDTAVVPVKKQACYGCYMKLSDKIYSSVIKTEDIVTCPHCGRVIYKDPEEQEA